MTVLTPTRCASVALFGLPNAGKSTLLNAFVGEKIAPVHRKPQMTRKNLLGIYTDKSSQFLFTDTPGFHASDKALNKELHRELLCALEDADIVIILHDVQESLHAELVGAYHNAIQNKKALILLNKSDVPASYWKTRLDDVKKIFLEVSTVLVSAQTGVGLEDTKKILAKLSPVGPFLYPKDELTGASLRELAATFIQEQVMEHLEEELPYQTAVTIEDYRESPQRDQISAVITVNRDSQKGMVIGKGGTTLKKIGTGARLTLESFLGRKVTLKIFVKVDKNWVNRPQSIREYYGFGQE